MDFSNQAKRNFVNLVGIPGIIRVSNPTHVVIVEQREKPMHMVWVLALLAPTIRSISLGETYLGQTTAREEH